MRRPWKELIAEIVERLPQRFELRDILKYEPQLGIAYPDNKHIGAKIRQTLQLLRDHGSIVFEGHGKYAKSATTVLYSPLIDFTLGAGFVARTQIARIVLETWAEYNLFCLACESDRLIRLGANTPVADFECGVCASRYQLKGKDGRVGAVIPGAAYVPMIDAIRADRCPTYILLEYDRRFSTVVFGSAIRGSSITEDRIVRRKPLKSTAKRAGWIGCNLRIEGLPRVAVVEPHIVEPSRARSEWASG